MSVKILRITIFVVFVSVIVGCSGSPRPVKPGLSPETSPADIPVAQPERKLTGDDDKFNVMTFPVFNDPLEMESWIYREVISSLHRPLELYKDVHGYYPDSIRTLVKSGFLLTWPRNLLAGGAVKCVVGRNLTANRADWASFKYELIGDNSFVTKVVSLDKKLYEETGNEVWTVRERENMFKLQENQRRRSSVSMGTKPVYEIQDANKRAVYAMCGVLTKFLDGRTHAHYYQTWELPNTFGDLFDNRLFIIKENFDSFAKMLKESGATFKWGVDHTKNCVYSILEIDGERLISYCVRFGPIEESPYTSGLQVDCGVDDLDMSSPILTDDNIADLVIPEEYLISINNLPLNEQ
jgi:hypothetical protein